MSGFLKRWSNRKAEASRGPTASDIAAETLPSPAPPVHAPVCEVASTAAPDETSAQAQEALDEKLAALPALDEIDATTDIRPFLQDFVPAALRKAAMRRAWAADPIISTHLDVARDYAWEFNVGEGPVGFYKNLGSDAIQRGLDALEQAGPAPVDESPARKSSGVEGESPALPPESTEAGPEITADTAEARDKNTHSARPLALHLSQKHGRALPD